MPIPCPAAGPALLAIALAACTATASRADPEAGTDQADRVSIQAQVEDGSLRALAKTATARPCSEAWAVFTDVDGMARFLPGVESSRIESREGSQMAIVQSGRSSYGVFSHAYRSKRILTLSPPGRIDSRSVPGEEVAVASSTTFAPAPGGGCSIEYSTLVGLPSWAPSFAAAAAAKSMARAQMAAMVAEIEKRAGLAK